MGVGCNAANILAYRQGALESIPEGQNGGPTQLRENEGVRLARRQNALRHAGTSEGLPAVLDHDLRQNKQLKADQVDLPGNLDPEEKHEEDLPEDQEDHRGESGHIENNRLLLPIHCLRAPEGQRSVEGHFGTSGKGRLRKCHSDQHDEQELICAGSDHEKERWKDLVVFAESLPSAWL